MGWQETGYIEVDEGYCKLNGCGNGYYLSACGELLRPPFGIIGLTKCPKCGKPLMTIEGEE